MSSGAANTNNDETVLNPRKRAREEDAGEGAHDSLLDPHEQAIENHHKQLVDNIGTLYLRNGELSDVTFHVGTPPKRRRFNCHRLILALQSPVFKAMLYGDFMESNQSEITLDDVSPDTFAQIHQYIYTGQINLEINNALALIMLADRYGLTTLTSECVKIVRASLTHENVFRITDQYSAVEDLRRGCIAYIGDHAATLLTSDTVLELSEDMLGEVLRWDYLVVDEIELFNLIVRWGEHQIRTLTGEPSSTPAEEVVRRTRSSRGASQASANGSASGVTKEAGNGNGKEKEKEKDEMDKVTLKSVVANLVKLIRLPMISPQQLWEIVAKSGVVEEHDCLVAIAFHSVPQVIGAGSPVVRRRCSRAITYLSQTPKSAHVRFVLERYTNEAEKHCVYSPPFDVGGHKWRLYVGSNTQCKKKFAVYVDLAHPELKQEPEASFSLHLCKFANPKERVTKTADRHKFTEDERDWGFTNFINVSDLKKYIQDNALMIEAEITVE
eukprot:Opistho-2@7191